jgi:hypothetical protein
MLRKLVVVVSALAASTAGAEPSRRLSELPAGTLVGGRLKMAITPPEQFNSSPPFEVSNVLYLNRCTGGCDVYGGTMNDARMHISTFIGQGPHVVTEFQNNNHETGAAADAEWNQVVQCIKEIYSPFNIVVTDVPPAGNANWTEAIIAGTSEDVGLPDEIGGVAPAHTGCEPNDNAMSYSFANNDYYFGDPQYRIYEICAVAGQESAHHYGLDHSYEFFDGRSACNDPMTYRTDCGGQRFFRNIAARCGEYEVRECMCGGLQNTHEKIMKAFGPGQTLIPPPTVSITSPAAGATVANGQVVTFDAGSERGVERSELILNGYKWAEVGGAAFGADGQPNPAPYNMMFPPGVPDGIIDIEVITYDDLGASTTSETLTVTKGAPCTSADTCATGQTCSDGKCFWPAPTGELGDDCGYDQFCKSNSCVETSDGSYCTQDCVVGATDTCPMGFECLADGTGGVCIPQSSGGGCCSVERGGRTPWGHAAFAFGVLALVVRRRRRRRR